MTAEIINGIRVLRPDGGMWLCKKDDETASKEVWLGKEADPSLWEEITDEEKQTLEAAWRADEPELDREAQLEVENKELRSQVAALQKRIDELEFESGGSVVKPDIPYDPKPDKPLTPKPGGGLTVGG